MQILIPEVLGSVLYTEPQSGARVMGLKTHS